VESYDAMVSGRPYKPAHKTGYSLRDDEEIELSEIESAKLLEIDPDTLNVFCEELKKTMDESAKFF
jgi:HD-GYP domain-containing protein (c-di-GMP phosphodiesterase class II)